MPTPNDTVFNDLVEHYLGKRLPDQLAAPVSMLKTPPEAQSFIIRMLSYMKIAGYSATDFTPALIHWLFSSLPNMLPSAWEGRIPPITLPNRHKKLDVYISRQKQFSGSRSPVFIDVGCGFPPVTTADTGKNLSDWKIFGVDNSFADYVLYDADGNYACFDEKGAILYVQTLSGQKGDPDMGRSAIRKRFNQLFSELFPLLQSSNAISSEKVERNGHKLIFNHYRDSETENIKFIKSDIMELHLPPANVVRCMNVVVYFAPEIRKHLLQNICALLDNDGILIVGTNGLGIQFRYAVYCKRDAEVKIKEFAFSLDNLGPITFMPWFSVHENDPDAILLAKLAAVLRSESSFWRDFSKRIDEIMQDMNVCWRGSNGFLHFKKAMMSPGEYLEKNFLLWTQIDEEGYCDRAVDVLKKTGYDAWRNPVGDIAVRPPENTLS